MGTFPRILLFLNILLSCFYCLYMLFCPVIFLPSYLKVHCFNVTFSLDVTCCGIEILIFHPTPWPFNLCLFLSSEYACQYVQFILLCCFQANLFSRSDTGIPCITLQHSTMLSCRLCSSWECQSQNSDAAEELMFN